MTTHMLLRVPTDCCWQPRRWEVGHVMAIMLLAFIAMLVSACGGGGGSAPTPTEITTQPASVDVVAGATPVTLGRRVLRTETAALAALAVLL